MGIRLNLYVIIIKQLVLWFVKFVPNLVECVLSFVGCVCASLGVLFMWFVIYKICGSLLVFF